MNQKFIKTAFLCIFFQFCFFQLALGQTDANASNKVEESFSWEKQSVQKNQINICPTPKTMVYIFSDISTFVLMDGENLVRPVSSEVVIQNVKKHTFCLAHPASDFVVAENQSTVDTSISVASFIVSTSAEKIPEIAALLEQAQNNPTQQLTANTTEEVKPAQPVSTSTIPSPTVFAISWHKLAPQKIEKEICDSSRTMIFIYSSISKFVLTDGHNLVSPVSSTLFVENIKQNIFCVENPSHSFIVPQLGNVQKEAAAFIVRRSGENLSEIAALIERTIKIQQGDTLENINEHAENEIDSITSKNTEAQPSEKAIFTVKGNESSNSVKTENVEELQGQGNYSGYRIQLMAKLKSDYTPESIDKYFKIPHKIRIDYDGTWHRFTLGDYNTLEEAQAILDELGAKYSLKEMPFISLYKNDIRISVFLQ